MLVLTPFAWAAAIASPGFALAAAVAVGVPLVKARNRRNYFFIGLLLLLALADLAMQLALLGVLPAPVGAALQLGLDVVLFIMAVMGGRVIPMFTNNGVAGAQARRLPGVERIALGLVLAMMVLDATGTSGWVLGVVASAGAVAHLVRGMLWQPWKTRHEPIVWVLHIAYLWVPLHLVLRALVQLDAVAPSAATHALTVGAMGGLIIGMMTRTARGHTGRMLRAGAAETACYVLVSLAACVRVFGPLLAASFTLPAVLLSAALWCAGFALYAVRYWPFLTRPRADGRPG